VSAVSVSSEIAFGANDANAYETILSDTGST